MLAFNSDGGSFEARIVTGHGGQPLTSSPTSRSSSSSSAGQRHAVGAGKGARGGRGHSRGGTSSSPTATMKSSLKNYEHIRTFDEELLVSFLERYYDSEKNMYLVYGGHGMGDYLELEENKIALQVADLADILTLGRRGPGSSTPGAGEKGKLRTKGKREAAPAPTGASSAAKEELGACSTSSGASAPFIDPFQRQRQAVKYFFEAIVFDACFMANLDCVYSLRHNTNLIGACEGYMWENDDNLDAHIFNSRTAAAMSRMNDPMQILEFIQRDYCSSSKRGDFSILSTEHVEELHSYCESYVIPRVYDRATFYTSEQTHMLHTLAEEALATASGSRGEAGSTEESDLESDEEQDVLGPASAEKIPRTEGATGAHDDAKCPALPSGKCGAATAGGRPGRLSKRMRLLQGVQFEHSLYPSELDDKYLLDLRSYLFDIVREEEIREQAALAAASAISATAPSLQAHGRAEPTGGGRPIEASSSGVLSGSQARAVSGSAECLETETEIAAAAREAAEVALSQEIPRTRIVETQGRIPEEDLPAAATAYERESDGADGSARSTSRKGAVHAVTTSSSQSSLSGKKAGGSSRDAEGAAASRKTIALRGLELFYKVVRKHTQPEERHVYASYLGGLSISVHEFSLWSKPRRPWKCSTEKFRKKAEQFLRQGRVRGVRMTEAEAATSTRRRSESSSEAGASSPKGTAETSKSALGTKGKSDDGQKKVSEEAPKKKRSHSSGSKLSMDTWSQPAPAAETKLLPASSGSATPRSNVVRRRRKSV